MSARLEHIEQLTAATAVIAKEEGNHADTFALVRLAMDLAKGRDVAIPELGAAGSLLAAVVAVTDMANLPVDRMLALVTKALRDVQAIRDAHANRPKVLA